MEDGGLKIKKGAYFEVNIMPRVSKVRLNEGNQCIQGLNHFYGKYCANMQVQSFLNHIEP